MTEPFLMILRWDRAAIADGEWWRLVTGHLVHLDAAHAALNVVGVVFVLGLFWRELTLRQWGVLGLVAMGVIDAGLWWFTSLDWYAGFSGVVHAMAAAGLVRPLLAYDRIAWIVSMLGLLKILFELERGPLPFLSWVDGAGYVPVVTEVHAFGVVAGLVVGLWARRSARSPQTTRP